MNVLEEVGRYTINFADSAAVARMKIGNGSGESRLYVGQTTDQIKIRNFFFEDVRFYFFCINDILKYLNIAKEEYFCISKNNEAGHCLQKRKNETFGVKERRNSCHSASVGTRRIPQAHNGDGVHQRRKGKIDTRLANARPCQVQCYGL